MRHFFSILLVCFLGPSLVASAHDFKSGDLYFNVTGKDEVEVTHKGKFVKAGHPSYPGIKEITIPSSVSRRGVVYKVTGIGRGAFCECKDLEKVIIGDGISSIGDYAFLSCTTLQEVVIPESVRKIGDSAFCESGISLIRIPQTVQEIGSYAFSRCGNLATVLYDGDRDNPVEWDIPPGLFNNCKSLVSLSVKGRRVTCIGEEAFYACKQLYYFPFEYCKVVGNNAFAYCDKLGEKQDGIFRFDEIETIGDHAFYSCGSLQEILVSSENLSSVGSYAFGGCSSLIRIILPKGVSAIPGDSFYATPLQELYCSTDSYRFSLQQCNPTVFCYESLSNLKNRGEDQPTELFHLTYDDSLRKGKKTRLKVDMCLYHQGGLVINVGKDRDFCFRIIKYRYCPDAGEVWFIDPEHRISLLITPFKAELAYGQNYREYFFVAGESRARSNATIIEQIAEKFSFKESASDPNMFHYIGF